MRIEELPWSLRFAFFIGYVIRFVKFDGSANIYHRKWREYFAANTLADYRRDLDNEARS